MALTKVKGSVWDGEDNGQALSVKDYGAVGDGVTDDSGAIQAAIDAAAALAGNYYRVEVDLAGSVYGVGSVGIQMGGASGVVLRNGRLVAVGAWATSTDPIIDMTNATNYRSAGIEGVVVECGQICSGIDIQRGHQCHINDTHVLHFTDYGIRTRTTATDLALVNTISSEWKYGEAGWTDAAANKAARAFDIQTADFQMVNCTGSYSLTPLYIDNMSNGQITNCHFYNSSSGTDPIADEEAIYIGSAANNLMFSNCYIDKGMLHLEDSFNHTFMNCLFVGGGDNTYAIQLTTSASGETAAELAMIGCSFASYGSNQLNLATNGGTWSALTAFTWVGNRDTDGTIAYKRFQFPGLIADVTDWQIADKNISLYKSTNGDIEVQSTVNLRLGADDGNTKAAAYSNIYLSTNGTDKVILDSDGGLYTANATGTSAGADSINIGDAYYVDNNKKADINSLYLTPLTFATLPGSPTQGQSCYITDSNTAVFNAAAAGGGANVVKVNYNGTAWVVG